MKEDGQRKFCPILNSWLQGDLRARSVHLGMELEKKQADPELDKLFQENFQRAAGVRNDQSIFVSEPSETLSRLKILIKESIEMKDSDLPDKTLLQLRQDYSKLDFEHRQKALVGLATQFGVDRTRVSNTIDHYRFLGLGGVVVESESAQTERYKTERELRSALVPLSSRMFERMNCQPGGFKFLVELRADLLATIGKQNLASLRALDTELKGMLSSRLGPACLRLQQVTWENSAALLERIVVYEAVHPITNLYDLKRRLGSSRRCYGFFHPAILGEPLVFIEVALTKDLVGSIQDVLFEEPPISEANAKTALFYSISATQKGLAGIDLGNFLIKRVARLLQLEMPNIKTFVTLSPIPGFMNWLLPKLEAHIEARRMSESNLVVEKLFLPDEEKAILEASKDDDKDWNAAMLLYSLLKSPFHDWANSDMWKAALKAPLMRLCSRYLLNEKNQKRALDPVANFHIRNGAIVERLNWMGDTSDKGLAASAGMMVNYMYRLDQVEENNQAYVNKGVITASPFVVLQTRARV